ncbi:MAG: hypothetical protein M0Z47_10890 [Actinomycetota bacterium]|nr:hypothetical protein [Actinomycetota bacterium]
MTRPLVTVWSGPDAWMLMAAVSGTSAGPVLRCVASGDRGSLTAREVIRIGQLLQSLTVRTDGQE